MVLLVAMLLVSNNITRRSSLALLSALSVLEAPSFKVGEASDKVASAAGTRVSCCCGKVQPQGG